MDDFGHQAQSADAVVSRLALSAFWSLWVVDAMVHDASGSSFKLSRGDSRAFAA